MEVRQVIRVEVLGRESALECHAHPGAVRVILRVADGAGGELFALALVRKHFEDDAVLLQVVLAARAAGGFAGAGQRRQQNRRQDSDNCDNHQQFDQRKTPASAGRWGG